MTKKYEWRKTRSQGANGGLPSLVLYCNDEYTAKFVTQDKKTGKIEYSATGISGYNDYGDVAYFGTKILLFNDSKTVNVFLKSKNILPLNEEQMKYVETVDSYSVHLHNFSDFTVDVELIELERVRKESESVQQFLKKAHDLVTMHNDIRIIEPSISELKEYFAK
jgi:hypothetical protein